MPPAIQTKLRHESYASKWRQAVRGLYPLIESKPSGDRVAINFLTFMKKHAATIHRLVEQAEQLAKLVQEQSPPPVLCHSDIHAGQLNLTCPYIYGILIKLSILFLLESLG